jgi:amino acid transporter
MTDTKSEDYRERLPRVLGPWDAVAVVVGSIIGSGIFLKVDAIATAMGSFIPILLIWTLGGIASLGGSLALAELAAMLPHAGGPYVYLSQAYGRLAAFLWGWAEFAIIRTGSLGSLACATVIYLNKMLEGLEERGLVPDAFADYVPLSFGAQGTLTFCAVAALSTVNMVSTRGSALTQSGTTIIKLAFLAFLALGPFVLGQADTNNLQPLAPSNWNVIFMPAAWQAVGLALVAVYWPYDGWINIGPVAEEIREPQRNVPLGLFAGMLIVTGVYVAVNIGYCVTLPLSEVQQTKTIAANVAGKLLGPWGAVLAAAGVMFSTFGALNSNLLAGPRIYFAMARDRLFPASIGRVDPRFKTPLNAVFAQGSWALIQVVIAYSITDSPREAFDTLTDFVVLGGTIFYALTVAAVFVLRYTMPKAERPYRTWGYPFMPIIYLATALVVVVSSLTANQTQGLAVAGLLAVGYCVYLLFRRLERGEKRTLPEA